MVDTIHTQTTHSGDMIDAPHRVYMDFYKRYGGKKVDGERVYPEPVIEGRVIHFDDRQNSRDTHIIVRQKRGLSHAISSANDEEPFTRVYFPEGSFIVATTDGRSIDEWEVLGVDGVVPGHFDGVQSIYDPTKVLLCFELQRGENERATLVYNSDKGDGTLQVGSELGWILDPHTSKEERILALNPVPGDISQLGEKALTELAHA